MSPKLKVAIIGGSFCGCTLANGLLRYPNIEFDVFESKPNFTERGAGVSLGANAKLALRSMGLDAERMFRDAGAVRTDSARCLVANGEHKGKTVVCLPPGSSSVGRIEWLQQLLLNLPPERLHANKKLLNISQSSRPEGPCSLHFEDESTHYADVVIGCDGLHSTLRKIVLTGQDTELIAPRFGGFWDMRGVTTPQAAADRFGIELFNPLEPAKVGLVGDGAFMLFSPRNGGAQYGVLLSAAATSDYDSTAWKPALTREFLEKTYESWDENFRSAVIECILAEDSNTAYSLREAPVPSTYHNGRLCIIGDAAHAMLPHMGAGAGLAIEDAAVMAALLGSADSSGRIETALQVFERVRRIRWEFISRKAHDAARLLTGQLGLDPEEIAALEPSEWWKYIAEFDVATHVEEALKQFQGKQE